jgi:hypothetical protein
VPSSFSLRLIINGRQYSTMTDHLMHATLTEIGKEADVHPCRHFQKIR